MNIEVRESHSNREWDDLVSTWRSGSIFHRTGWLEAAQAFSRYRLTRLIAELDGERLAALPVFVTSLGPVRVALSPPPKLALPFLGPLFADDIFGRTREERTPIDVLTTVLENVRINFRPSLTYLRTVPTLTDPRLFGPAGYAVETLYTYVVPLPRRPDDLISKFTKSLRSDIRRTQKRIEVRTGGRDTSLRAHEFVSARYREQGQTFGPAAEYFVRLYDALGPAFFQPIEARTDRGLEAAAVVTFQGRRASYWQGAARPHASRLPLTDHLIWYAMNLAIDRGMDELDLVGANVPRLAQYKAKFRPRLEPYFEAFRSTRAGRVIRGLYHVVRGVRR